MNDEAVIDQVAGILVRNDVNYSTRDDGRGYLAQFGSAGVYVDFVQVADRSTVLVRAVAVEGLELDDAKRLTLLERLNKLNTDEYYAKAYLKEAFVQVEYALLGESLNGDELMNALLNIARVADDLDDELIPAYGGRSFETVIAETEGADKPVDT